MNIVYVYGMHERVHVVMDVASFVCACAQAFVCAYAQAFVRMWRFNVNVGTLSWLFFTLFF